ncbi:MAG TPA: DNA replication/repair protein RecF [Mycobacteriales bacterium]|jgi:DNA replication and repair protein RecF|nr:DNA replication/repair protein RecF [Mycobacteriales bacterium]
MHVRQLFLKDFRSYTDTELELVPGVNLFVGPNGQGKTNLVEAVGYVATLGSHRVSSDAPLVRSGASTAIVRCAIVSHDRELLVELQLIPGKTNRARLNRSPVSRPRGVLGALRTVLFAPEDLALVRGDPSERRRFIDDFLVTRSPRFAAVRSDYDRVLKQRNALLKTAGSRRWRRSSGTDDSAGDDLRTLEVWDSQIARCGSQLLAGRIAAVEALAPYVSESYRAVSNSPASAQLCYSSSLTAALGSDETSPSLTADADVLNAQLLAALARTRQTELERGITLVGPHRDDILLQLGELPAKGYASHGESWSFALALRLACFELLRNEGSEPVLILDDVFAELDSQRRRLLAQLVTGAAQVLVTAAVVEDVPESLLDASSAGARFDVADGEVHRVY